MRVCETFMTPSYELFCSVKHLLVLADKELREPVPDMNKVYTLCLGATCAAQELKNRYNGQLPPPEGEPDNKWNVRELL